MSAVDYLKQNWVKILLIFVGLFFAIGIVKGIVAIFNGPFGNGVADVFGAAANLVNGFINGCKSQADCSKPTDKDICLQSNGCSWDPGSPASPPSPAVSASCINTTGRKPGDGSFFSTSCLLGMGFIAYLALILVGPLLKFVTYLAGGAKDFVKDHSRLTGQTVEKSMTELTTKANEAIDKVLEALKKGGVEIDKTLEKEIAKIIAARTGSDSVAEAAEGSSSVPPGEAAEMSAAAAQEAAEIEDKSSETIASESPDKADPINDAIDKVVPK